LFDYDWCLFFYGYCEVWREFRFYYFSRVNNFKILNDKFKTNVKYNLKKIINKSFGIIDDEPTNFKLKIHYPMSQIVKERQYSMNQIIKEIDDETIYFEAKQIGRAHV